MNTNDDANNPSITQDAPPIFITASDNVAPLANQLEDDLFADFKPSQQEETLFFVEEPPLVPSAVVLPKTEDKWKVLIVDDERDIHEITYLVLQNYQFKNKGIEFYDAYSAAEAQVILAQHTDIALAFLDVVMENDSAGLGLVRYIREQLNNQFIRIVLRTGQPGYAPEEEIITQYDINDYANKAELSRQKLITLVTASLRAFDDLLTLESYRQGLEQKVIERTVELQQANEQLIVVNQEKNEFLGIAAHDLKNPLSGILGIASLVKESCDELNKAELLEYMSMIENSAHMMFQLIKNLLDVNAIESGKLNFEFQTHNIYATVQYILRVYSDRAKEKQINLTLISPSNHYYIHVDNNVITQIIDNLISNAIKYSPFNRSVLVRLSYHAGKIRFEVQDEGVGISEEEQKKLFCKFTRLTARPTGNEHSTGLGLFIVKRLVEAMNGRVWCESELGKGSTFFVEFDEHAKLLKT